MKIPESEGTNFCGTKARYITKRNHIPKVAEILGNWAEVGVDIETCSRKPGISALNTRHNEIRLLTLSGPGWTFVIDCWKAKGWETLLPLLSQRRATGHNISTFDAPVLWRHGYRPDKITDTMVSCQVLNCGLRRSWKYRDVSKDYMGIDVDKDVDHAMWREWEIPTRGLQYAASDTAPLLGLDKALRDRCTANGLTKALDIEDRFIPFLVWMSVNGVPFDTATWEAALAETWEIEGALYYQLQEMLPKHAQLDLFTNENQEWDLTNEKEFKRVLKMMGYDEWCIEFKRQQWLERFEKLRGNEVMPAFNPKPDHNKLMLALWDNPISKPITEFRSLHHLIENYGENWLRMVEHGRVYPYWKQVKNTGRMGCGKGDDEGDNSNSVQNIPRPSPANKKRKVEYRSAFRAPEGRTLIVNDYNGIEVRVGCMVAPEPVIRDGYLKDPNQDVHKMTAALMWGIPLSEVTKDQRQIAKSAYFGFQFGAGVQTFIFYCKKTGGPDLEFEQATDIKRRFDKAYQGLKGWHRRVGADKSNEVRTLTGRRRILPRSDWMTAKCNTVVQGTAADGAKRAGVLCWERRHELPEGAFPILINHDELVFECNEEDKHEVTAFVKKCMVDGMQGLIYPVPVIVEGGAAKTWAEK